MSPGNKLYLARISVIDEINNPHIIPTCKLLYIFKYLWKSVEQDVCERIFSIKSSREPLLINKPHHDCQYRLVQLTLL